MNLTNSTALFWGLLAVPIVLMYARKQRAARVTTCTGMFWEQVLAEQSARTAWRPWRCGVSLAVQLGLLALAVLALADPQFPTARQLVVIVDNTSAMSREQRESADRLIGSLRPSDRMGLLSAAGAVGVRCNLTGEKAMLREALDAMPNESKPLATQAEAVARRMLRNVPNSEILRLGKDGLLVDVADGEKVVIGVYRQGWTPWPLLIGLAAVLLAVEWSTYQRRWSC